MLLLIFERIAAILTRELTVLLTAIIPGVELRGAIPVGMALGMGGVEAFFMSYLGSLIPAIPILVFLPPLLSRWRQSRIMAPFAGWITARAERKGRRFDKCSLWGLMFFVAVPLPSTGVWTGSMIAAVLGLPPKRSLAAIALGNLVAGALVTIFVDRIF